MKYCKYWFVRISALSWPDRFLLAKVFPVVAVSRAALYVLPFRWTWRVVSSLGLRPGGTDDRRLAWAVDRASLLVPEATCLTQALALRFLMGRSAPGLQVRIGVRRDGQDEFKAHAWVERYGETLIGGEEAAVYEPLLTLGGEKAAA
jgi:hypothetical protein